MSLSINDNQAALDWSEAEWSDLAEAKQTLEHEGLADRLTEAIGTPIHSMVRALPDSAENLLRSAIEKALQKALEVAIATIDDRKPAGRPKLIMHKVLSGVSGAAGGAFGIASVAAELPVSTVLILRSIADIARSQGEDLENIETRLACLEVFALGGHCGDDAAGSGQDGSGQDGPGEDGSIQVSDRTEIGYFAVRAGMAKQIADAAKYLGQHSARNLTAPPLVRLIQQIGSRFGVVVSEKVAAQAVPILGAVGGALINSYFIDHYQDLARAHFTIRRLERSHGSEAVREAYANIAAES